MHDGQTVTINGQTLWYRIAGSGPPLVVQAPGWGVAGGYLEQTLRPLEESFTVIYFDPRGSGRSARLADAEAINAGAMVADLEGLRQHLGFERFALLGHSHGGYIALNYALRHPERLSHLILVGSILDPEEAMAEADEHARRLSERPEFTRAARAWLNPGRWATDAEFGEWIRQTMPLYFHRPEVGLSVFARLNIEDPSLAAAQGTRPTDHRLAVRDQLHRIRVPTLILAGRHDFRTSLEHESRLHQGIPGSRMVVFEESGHFPWIEEPAAFFHATREFLQEKEP